MNHGEREAMPQNDPLFISIIPNFAGEEEYLADLIRERHGKTGIRYYAMCYPLHPQGDDIYDKVKIQKESFRKLKGMLAGEKGIRLGILFQSTLGHGGNWNLTPQCSIQADRIVRADGTETHRCCPLDDRFLEFIRRSVATLCEEHPDFTLGDDDMRFFDGTCYCDRHVRLVAEMTGREFTRESLAAAVASAGPRDAIAEAFEKAQVEAMRRLCATVRQAIDSVDPSINCGCCIVGSRYDYAETECRELAGKNQPFLRIGNATYLEGALKESIWRDAATGFQVAVMKGKGIRLLDESDTCPHNRYSKSARTMHAHIAAGLLRGLDGGKLWLDQGAHPLRELSRPYEKILSENRGLYRCIMEIVRAWHPVGGVINVPPLEREPYPAIGTYFMTHCGWANGCFGRIGFPVYYGQVTEHGLHLLNGGQIDYYTDDELRLFLAEAALVDGPAAVKLTERGMANLIGVAAEKRPFLASRETACDSGITVGFTPTEGTPFLTPLPNAETLSEVFFSQYRGGASERIMAGSTFAVNDLGGKVVVTAMNLQNWHPMHIVNPGRKLMMESWLERLGGMPAWIPEMQDARIVCGILPDNGLVCAVFNTSYDPLPVGIRTTGAVRRLWCLSPDGEWEEASFTMDGNTVETPWVLEPGELVVCRLASP